MFHAQCKLAVCFLAMSLLAATTASAVESAAAVKQRMGSGNPVAGKTKSTLCQGCHGEAGYSLEELIPHLAGQYSTYIVRQLRNFQTRERDNQIMHTISMSVNNTDLADIAAYFASQERMHGNGWGNTPMAKNLFLKGDVTRNIRPCASCHGANGDGKTSKFVTYPVIGGQHKEYLRSQLINWRKGKRTNSQGGVMNKITKSLTDAEIEALADYISGM